MGYYYKIGAAWNIITIMIFFFRAESRPSAVDLDGEYLHDQPSWWAANSMIEQPRTAGSVYLSQVGMWAK